MEIIGECLKCQGKMKMSRCGKRICVKFVVEGVNGRKWYLTAFNEKVQAIVYGESGSSIEEKMFSIGSIKLSIDGNVVKGVMKSI